VSTKIKAQRKINDTQMFVDKVETQLRQKPLRGSQTQEFHFQSDVSQFCLQVRRISSYLLANPDDRAVPSERPSVHCSISSDDVSFRPDTKQSSITRPNDVLLPSGPNTVSRSFCFSLLRPDVSAARLDASLFSNGSLILSKFQERKDQSTVWMMWYPVRTRVSKRQESQFKIDPPDVWQLWSGCWCIVYGNCRFKFNRPDAGLSWSGRMHIRYGNYVLKFSRLDAHPSWSGRSKA
jgi:hypothetical protein